MPQVDVRSYDTKGSNCSDRIKAAMVMGCVIGMTIGGLFGASAAFRHGVGGNDVVRQVGKSMLNAGLSFGVFMSVGAFIRC